MPGTLIFDVTDPNLDDNGPGNYAYPTSDNFKPGAFDIQEFQVYDAGSNVIFRLKTRDLTETFGSPLGAQLVDLYVHVPGAVTTSTAAANASRNFTIAAPFAWSRLIQVQGFGQRYVDAGGATLGTVGITANPVSRFITSPSRRRRSGRRARAGASPSSSPARKAATPTRHATSSRRRRSSGSASARRRAPTRTAPFPPGSVPKAIDVIPPPGVMQSTELDYTLGPVVLSGVSIP